MRSAVINRFLNLIKKNYNYDDIKISEIKYGLEAIYILITKAIVILTSAFILGIFTEVIVFTLIYSLIRMFSFGLHATKSWICLVCSLIIFIILPYLCTFLSINIYIKSIISIIGTLLIFKNAPADTSKRPIINIKRRERYKFLSTVIAIIMVFASLYISNNFISNCLLFCLLLQNCMISKFTYKLFGLSYDNYKKYLNMV